MKTKLTPRAWQNDAFWTDVVCVITGGPDVKLRADHYLENLSAEQLEELREVLSSPGTSEQQRRLCPKRRGGRHDGEPPGARLLSEITKAIRRAAVLKELRVQREIQEAAAQRCKELGLDPTLTNAVLRGIGEEALAQKAEMKLGTFALGAAAILLNAESSRTKGKQEEVKIEIRKESGKLRREKLQLDIQKFQRGQIDLLKKYHAVEGVKEILGSEETEDVKTEQLGQRIFGKLWK
jgi:hypothetical protein